MLVTQIRSLAPDAAFVEAATVEAACGFPSPSQDYQTTEIDLNEYLMPNRVATIVIRTRGHSMTLAGIFDGEELIVDRSITPEDGHVVVAVLDNEMTVKRLRVTDADVTLATENIKHSDIEVPELSDLRIWGVVTRNLHRVARA